MSAAESFYEFNHDGCCICQGAGPDDHFPISPRQMDFLVRSEFEVLFGGARGGGKTYALLLDVLQHVDEGDWRGLFLRRSMPQLKEAMDIARKMFPRVGAYWLAGEKTWVFPSGARLEMAFCEHDDDVERYQGRTFHALYIDELGHWKFAVYVKLWSSVRSGNPRIRCQVRCSANPLGQGHRFIKERFVDPKPSDTPIWDSQSKHWRVYLRSLPSQNPFLQQDYIDRLHALPTDAQRRAMIYGDWDTIEGTMFGGGWNRAIHVVKPFKLSTFDEDLRAGDHGFNHPAAFLWAKRDQAKNLVIHRELVVAKRDATQLGEMINEVERSLGFNPGTITGPLDPQAWERIGTGVTPADCYMRAGVRWFKARKGPESRKIGCYEMHRRLATFTRMGPEPELQRVPSIRIFDTCTNLISLLPILEPDPNDPEDTIKMDGDDAWDACRYLLRHVPMHSAPTGRGGPGGNGMRRALDGLRRNTTRSSYAGC